MLVINRADSKERERERKGNKKEEREKDPGGTGATDGDTE